MDTRFQLKFVVEQDGELLRDAIRKWGISKRALTAIKFNGGELLVNGEERNVRHPLIMGDTVTIIFPPEEASMSLVPEHEPFTILYEDDVLLIIDKPPYKSTIPSREHPTGSVANLVYGYFKKQQIASTVHIVTRLDRDTSGLMCIAKHRHIHHLMSEQQKAGSIHREYEALVHGIVKQEKQSVIAPIGRKETSIIEREVRSDGQFAHTDVRLLATILEPYSMSHIRLKLYTGRTHQIRVHMAHIGHPLVGDELYGGSTERLNRQALHCVSLQFLHPITRENMHFSSELLEPMKNLIKS